MPRKASVSCVFAYRRLVSSNQGGAGRLNFQKGDAMADYLSTEQGEKAREDISIRKELEALQKDMIAIMGAGGIVMNETKTPPRKPV